MNTNEIRKQFIDYFAEQGHQEVSSSSLVPANDKTLMFTNAGMVQFKDVFLGIEQRDYLRAVTSQRCVRAGGKHNDLENVGYTARHHTFFEMLGNFSFGDYFKQDAIRFAWNLLTERFGLPADRLWITVFEEDDEAEAIWLNEIGVPKERVIRIGAKDNFWAMGDTGPCGPCSEIFYDHGPDVAGGPPGSPDEDGDRYIEIWNLVFMQYNRDESGEMHPLPKPAVDTGMGLERIAAVLQHVHSNYEIDLFERLIGNIAEQLGVKDKSDKSLRVIADHLRSTAFMIVDGVTPSNEDRGYVLRRIIRRAIRHGHKLGASAPFLHSLVPALVAEMGEAYPELVKRQDLVASTLRRENEKFNETLDQGLRILNQHMQERDSDVLDGGVVFKLYDTFGFPADLTADVARENNLQIDQAGFDAAMQAQRDQSRQGNRFSANKVVHIAGAKATPFVGYDQLTMSASVTTLLDAEEQEVSALEAGAEGAVVLDKTAFYAESGGQVGDVGSLTLSDGNVFEVATTRYLSNKVIAHYGHLRAGRLQQGNELTGAVDKALRADSANNHSATHLMHAALINQLGEHVQQKGSLVNAQRLRFDFSHFQPLSNQDIQAIETAVNAEIRHNHEVSVDFMALESARAAGAAALFDEKYDDTVRVVRMGEYSFELCGGTHVARTGDIGYFKILQETGVAAGVRRIEAVTGSVADALVRERLAILQVCAERVNTAPEELLGKLDGLLDQNKTSARQVQQLKAELAASGGQAGALAPEEVNGIKLLAMQQDNLENTAMRLIVDNAKRELGSGVVLVAGTNEGKVSILVGVTDDLIAKVKAGDLVKQLAPLVAGRGGGKPNFAQGGGTDSDGIAKVMAGIRDILQTV